MFRINTRYGVLHIIVTLAGVLAQRSFCKRSSTRATHRCICSGCRIPRSHAGFVNTEIVFVTVRIAVLVVDVKQEIQECFSVGILVPHRLKRSNVVRLQMPIVLTPTPTEIFRPREIVPCLAFRYRAVYRNRRICLVHLIGIGVSLCSRLCACGDKSDCRSQNDLKCYERGGNNFANVFHSNILRVLFCKDFFENCKLGLVVRAEGKHFKARHAEFTAHFVLIAGIFELRTILVSRLRNLSNRS